MTASTDEARAANDARIEAAWRGCLPAGAARSGFTFAFCGPAAFDRAWVEDAAGSRREWEAPAALFDEVTRVRLDELEPGVGTWIAMRGELDAVNPDAVNPDAVNPDAAACRLERDRDARAYFGRHEGAPEAPPAKAKDIRPSDAEWREEFERHQRRDPAHIPTWAGGAPAPAAADVLDPTLPLPPEAAALAEREPWTGWIARLRAELERRCAGDELVARGLREPAGSELGAAQRESVVDAAGAELLDALGERPATELVDAWRAMTGRAFEGARPAGTIAKPVDADAVYVRAADEVVARCYALAGEILEASIRR